MFLQKETLKFMIEINGRAGMQKWANFKVKIYDFFIVCYFILQQKYKTFYSRPWPAVCITFVQITHQIQVLTEPLSRARAFFMHCRTTRPVPNIVG